MDVNPRDTRNETADQRADRNWGEILQELRVIQTGTQLISGFLLTVAFQPGFASLDAVDRVVYGVLIGLATVSTLIGLAIVALHRARFRHHEKPAVVTVADRMLRGMIGTVATLSVGVVLLIFDQVAGPGVGIAAAVVAAVIAVGFIEVFPRVWHS